MKLALGQINPTVGDLPGNVDRMVEVARRAAGGEANLVVFPEDKVVKSYCSVFFRAAKKPNCLVEHTLPLDENFIRYTTIKNRYFLYEKEVSSALGCKRARVNEIKGISSQGNKLLLKIAFYDSEIGTELQEPSSYELYTYDIKAKVFKKKD